MSRTFSFLILLAVIVGGFFLIRSSTQNANFTSNEDQKQSDQLLMPANFSDWRLFKSNNDHFEISFPGLPHHASDKILDPSTGELRKYDTYVAADNEGPALIVSVITFPENIDNTAELENMLKKVVDEMLKRNKENQLKSRQFGNFKGYKALDFSLNNAEFLIQGKLIAYKNRLFVLSMIGQRDTFNPKVLEFFIDSFQISEKSNSADENKGEESK